MPSQTTDSSYYLPAENKSSESKVLESEVLSVINGLERVEVQLDKDFNDIDVLDYFLKNAAGLSSMIIHYQPSEFDVQTLADHVEAKVNLHKKTLFSAIKFNKI